MNENEFGRQIKQQLDRGLDLGPPTLARLTHAREQAVARQRSAQPAIGAVWVDALVARLSGNPTATAGVAVASAALVLALIGFQHWLRTPTVEEIAEIDAALLSSELPINAYLDKGFDTWLKRSQH
jgi:hypothetical protein